MSRLKSKFALALVFATFAFASISGLAAPVTSDTAASLVKGWLRLYGRPLGRVLPGDIKRAEAVRDGAGKTLYYIVHLNPAGYVIVPADDLADPIIAFSASGDFDPASKGPAAALVRRDLPRRIARARRPGPPDAAASKATHKWHGLLYGLTDEPSDAEANGHIVGVSQIMVAPFVQTLWNQQSDASLHDACYNYYTPPGPNGDVNNYPCGCVATSLAQVIDYFQYPATGVGTASYQISVNGNNQMASLLGGDGAGGPYPWSQMPLNPNGPTATQAQAIGALCYDAGVAVGMAYAANGSSAGVGAAQAALTNVFKFAHAVYTENDSIGVTGTNLLAMLNPNLNARLPVVLGIESTQVGGHCVLADGYGYTAGTLFHHLNCGWGGSDDIWYALPAIDTDNGNFTLLDSVLYNIYTNGTGEIISGQVTDPTGAPTAGATVNATRTSSGGGTYSASTDTNGIYALVHLPSASQYTLTVTNTGYAAATGNYATGTSRYGITGGSGYEPSGDVWNANFVLIPPLLVMPETGFASIGPAGGPFSITSATYTLTNGSAASVNWSLANSAAWLSASASSGTLAAGAAAALTISLNAAASGLAASTNAAAIWITNRNNGLVQGLPFSLTVKSGDYPIAVTGYNYDVVVESNAVGGDARLYSGEFETNNPLVSAPFAFYQSGLPAYNAQSNAPAALGLPSNGLFTSKNDNATTFQLAPFTTNNVLYLTSASSSGSLLLPSPAAYSSLSILAASAMGGGNGTLVINFADGSASSPMAYTAPNYFTTNGASIPGAALTNFGILYYGNYNEFYTFDYWFWFPTLYQTTINLQSLGLQKKAIASVTFNLATGGEVTASTATGVFALSGTESPYPVIFSQPQSLTLSSGGAASLSAQVTGGATLRYSWLLNGSWLSGAQSNPLIIPSVGASNAGNYQLVISNTFGSVTSSVATLSITNLPVSFAANAAGLRYTNGDMILQLTNLTGQGAVVISASTNLSQWTPIFTNPSGFGTITITDAPAGLPRRFYRATVP